MKKQPPGDHQRQPFSFVLQPSHLLCAGCGLALLLLPAALRADEYSRVAHYSVRMFSYGLLTIDGRTGDIRVEGWDEPRLEIEAEKVVRAKSANSAEPLYDLLGIDLRGQDRQVQLRSIYPPRRLWRPFRDESKLSVNYRIRMPFDANLKLHCVDCDVSIRGLVGSQQVRVNYGDVEVYIPDVYSLRSLFVRSLLGYIQSNLHGEDSAGFAQRLWFWNPQGGQDINVRVRMGGVFVYRDD
jgi:hypothetical protein